MMPQRGFARLEAAERRVKRRRRYRPAPWARHWAEGLAVGVGFALLAGLGHWVVSMRW
jgi:ferric-dicitrate binding protein FerR (iron transport regulator)